MREEVDMENPIRAIIVPFLIVHAIAATAAVFTTAVVSFMVFGPPS